MASIDAGDKMKESFRNFTDYPMNLVGLRNSYASVLELRRRLESMPDIFSPIVKPVEFIESWIGEQYPQQSQVVDLAKHSSSDRKDPKSRSIFIPVQPERTALQCTAEQLLQILTYHQVMPRYMDMLLTFGQNSAVGSVYGQEDTLLEPREQRFEVKSLGRSGSSIQHCFRLRVMDSERSNQAPKWRWSVRQAAAYHAFDLVTGRAVWITATDDPNLTERLGGRLILNDVPLITDGSASSSIATSLGSTLTTTMEYFHWCEESWRQTARDIDDEYRRMSDKLAVAFHHPPKNDNEEPPDCMFEELRSLGKLKDCLEQALLAIKQDELVMDSIKGHYNDLLKMREVLDAMNGELCGDIGSFFEQTGTIKTNLWYCQQMLEVLKGQTEEKQEILRVELSLRVTLRKMHEIEIKTDRDIGQMRVTTISGMIFLPITFIVALITQNNREPPINQPSSSQPPPSTIHSPTRPSNPSIFDNWIFLLASSFVTVVALTRGALYLSRRPGARTSLRRIFGHKGARHSTVDVDMAEEMDTRGPHDYRRYGEDMEKTELPVYT